MTHSRFVLRLATAAMLLVAFADLGCAGARAYERGRLAKPRMQMDPDVTPLGRHVYEYREGSTGGYGSGGGGCGCN